MDNTYKRIERPSLERGHSLTAEFKVTFGTRTEGSVLWNDTPNTLVSDSIWQLESARDEARAGQATEAQAGHATLEAPPPSEKVRTE